MKAMKDLLRQNTKRKVVHEGDERPFETEYEEKSLS